MQTFPDVCYIREGLFYIFANPQCGALLNLEKNTAQY